mmetsp:Transcript_16287/g.35362  ORF Transcript_16287/g.35362 Transcript_16287/m.35362 type:complete len:214 (-) Transcript_16287:417-1058(-)
MPHVHLFCNIGGGKIHDDFLRFGGFWLCQSSRGILGHSSCRRCQVIFFEAKIDKTGSSNLGFFHAVFDLWENFFDNLGSTLPWIHAHIFGQPHGSIHLIISEIRSRCKCDHGIGGRKRLRPGSCGVTNSLLFFFAHFWFGWFRRRRRIFGLLLLLFLLLLFWFVQFGKRCTSSNFGGIEQFIHGFQHGLLYEIDALDGNHGRRWGSRRHVHDR